MAIPPVTPQVIHSRDSQDLDALGLESHAPVPKVIDPQVNAKQGGIRPVDGVSFKPKSVPLSSIKATPSQPDTQKKIEKEHEEFRDMVKQHQIQQERMMLTMGADYSRAEFVNRLLAILYSAGMFSAAVGLTVVTGGGGVVLLIISGSSLTMACIDAGTAYKDWRNRADGKEGFVHRGDTLANIIDKGMERYQKYKIKKAGGDVEGLDTDFKAKHLREQKADKVAFAIRLVLMPMTAPATMDRMQHPELLEDSIDPVRLQKLRQEMREKLHGKDIQLSDSEILRPIAPPNNGGTQTDEFLGRKEEDLPNNFKSGVKQLRDLREQKIAAKAAEAQRKADEEAAAEAQRLANEEAEAERLAAQYHILDEAGNIVNSLAATPPPSRAASLASHTSLRSR